MLDQTLILPEDPKQLRSFTARILAEVKAQAILIEKLRHQLAGRRANRFGASSETAEQLQLALETSEIAAAAMTARMKLPEVEEKDKPKRRPIPDHIPRMEVDPAPDAEACAACGGRLRRIGEDVTEELDYVPGRSFVNRIVRPRLRCTCRERFVPAPLPSRPIERNRQEGGTGKTRTARLWTYARDERPWRGDAAPAAWVHRRPKGAAPQGSPRPLPRLDACRRLCRVRRPLSSISRSPPGSRNI